MPFNPQQSICNAISDLPVELHHLNVQHQKGSSNSSNINSVVTGEKQSGPALGEAELSVFCAGGFVPAGMCLTVSADWESVWVRPSRALQRSLVDPLHAVICPCVTQSH